jgi:hypothetical protein
VPQRLKAGKNKEDDFFAVFAPLQEICILR